MEDQVTQYLKNIFKTMPSEDLYFEALRDIMKDLVKEYLRKKINENAELKNSIADVLQEYMEGKLKEYDSMAKMAKITAKIGLITTPQPIRDEAISDFMNVFQKEIEEIIKKTF